jgi:glycosyl hydrolase family 18 (putative chitinase)
MLKCADRPEAPRSQRRRRWLACGAVLLALSLAADYALYPGLSRPGGTTANRGENGLWLRYQWYFGERSDRDPHLLAARLREQQIRYAYFHVRHITGHGTLRYHKLADARRLIATLHRDAPTVKVIAWLFAGNARLASTGVGEVDLADPAVRKTMVGEARWLVNECGFDGVQWDYEICDNGDPAFLRLLQETRAALPAGKLLTAAVPMWLPAPFQRWGWSEMYLAQVAARCDQLAVMCYDSGIYLPRGYVWLVHQQGVHVTQAVARGNPRCRVLLGLPTYGQGGLSHHAWAENLRMALKGVREGLADPRANRSVFAGVALFADYTTQPEEWETYRALWLAAASRRLPVTAPSP